jgi:hypothetical protein
MKSRLPHSDHEELRPASANRLKSRFGACEADYINPFGRRNGATGRSRQFQPAMAHEIAKLLLEKAGTFLERAEAVKSALTLGMPLNEIEEYLDWIALIHAKTDRPPAGGSHGSDNPLDADKKG